jgi:predicted MFS family arabinose efflux permease
MDERARLVAQWPVTRMMLLATTGFTGFFVTLAALPAWIASQGASTASAGATTTVMLAATVVCQPLVPALLRRVSTTAVVALGMVLLGAPAPALIWASSGAGLYAICVVRGIGFAIFTIAGTVSTGEIAPPGRHGEVAGLYGLAAMIPNVVLVPLSVALLHGVGFWPVAVLAALPVPGALFAIGAGRRPSAGGALGDDVDGRGTARRGSAAAAAFRRALAPAAVLCALTIAGGAIVTILPISRSGFVATAGLALFGATAAAGRWQAGARVRRHGVGLLLPSACVIAAVGLMALAAGLSGGGAVAVLVGCAVAGIGFGAAQSLTLVSAFARTGPRERATASAVWNVAFDAGTAIGAVLIGALTATSLGIWGAFAVLAALVLAGVPLALASGRL